MATLDEVPRLQFGLYPTPVEALPRLRAALGARTPRLLIKRDDYIGFGFGGNKVRKLEYVVRDAVAEGAEALLTVGGVQSNHARSTAAFAARLGLRAVLVLNGEPPARSTANLLLDQLFGAEIHYVSSRAERVPRMLALAEEIRERGTRVYEIPLGASTPTGALGYARAFVELVEQTDGPAHAPDIIIHPTSSGGTQAGLLVGRAVAGLTGTQIIGISADEPADAIRNEVAAIANIAAARLRLSERIKPETIEVSDAFVGPSYGQSSDASREAAALIGRTEAIVVDHSYTAKALAALIAWVREGRFSPSQTVLFWHTGGQVGVFA